MFSREPYLRFDDYKSYIRETSISGSFPSPNIDFSNHQSVAKQVFDMMYGVNSPDVILKCAYCGQWGVISQPCQKCGATIR